MSIKLGKAWLTTVKTMKLIVSFIIFFAGNSKLYQELGKRVEFGEIVKIGKQTEQAG